MMSVYVKIVLFTLILIVVITLLCDNVADGKGGRGGGFRGGSRSFRSSRSYRSTRSSRTRLSPAARYRNSLRTRGYWKYAAGAGMIYGWSRYRRSPRYHSNQYDRPQICVNLYDYRSENGTQQQYFICPLAGQGEDYKYCCGPEDRQKCCRFWDNGGRVFGVVVGILIFLAVVGLIVYCLCCRQTKKPGFIKSFSKNEPGAKYAMTSTQPAQADVAPTYPQNNVVPPQTGNYPPGAQAPYPPAGGIGGDKPAYPPGPEATPYPPAPGGAYPPPQNNGPYPPPTGPEMPYPPPQNGAPPYPVQPMGNAPYPQNDGLPYAPNPGPPPAVAPPPYPANY